MKNQANNKKVNLENLTDEQLLNLDLDTINLNELLSSNKAIKTSLQKATNEKERIYKIDINSLTKTEYKSYKRKIRTKRNKFIDRLLYSFEQKNIKDCKEILKEFNVFYKETYFLNDYSIKSLARKNSDKQTLFKVKLFLEIIKQIK